MKAQEYVDTYMLNIKSKEECKERTSNMFKAFAGEFSDICKTRNVSTLSGQEGVVRELNEKWNAVAARVEKLYHQPLIKRNAVWNIFLSDMDEKRWPRKSA